MWKYHYSQFYIRLMKHCYMEFMVIWDVIHLTSILSEGPTPSDVNMRSADTLLSKCIYPQLWTKHITLILWNLHSVFNFKENKISPKLNYLFLLSSKGELHQILPRLYAISFTLCRRKRIQSQVTQKVEAYA